MAYNPTTWKDQVVTDHTKYKIIKENGSEEVVNIERMLGEIIQEGTRVTADKLNNIEQGIKGTSDLVNDLAGAGRMDETVKKNADDIGSLSTQMDESAKKIGRSQAEFGFSDAELTGCHLNSESNLILNSIAVDSKDYTLNQTGSYNTKRGFQFTVKADATVSKIKVSKSNSDNATKYYILDDTDTQIHSGGLVAGINEILVNLNPGTYKFLSDNGTTSYRTVEYTITGISYPIDFANVSIDVALEGETLKTTYAFTFSNITFESKKTSNIGTATKTISPQNIEKWGNLKVAVEDLGVNNSASVDIKDITGVTTLLSHNLVNGENLIDLSSINVSQYLGIQTVFILSRNSTSDFWPKLSEPSWTWLGDSGREDILFNEMLEEDVTEFSFDVNSSLYKKLVVEIFNCNCTHTSYSLEGRLTFNNDDTNNYSFQVIEGNGLQVANRSASYIIVEGMFSMSSLQGNEINMIIDLKRGNGEYKTFIKDTQSDYMSFGTFSYIPSNITNIKIIPSSTYIKSGTYFKITGVK